MSGSAKLSRMNVALRKPMTREEFFIWAEAQEGRYEFDGFRPVAMNGGTNSHGIISGNIYFRLRLGLAGSPCTPMAPEGGGIATIGTAIRYPEAAVSCSEIPANERLFPNPVVIFEVLSPSSRKRDIETKAIEYHCVPTIKRYVVLEQLKPVAYVHWRLEDEPWNEITLTSTDVLDLPEIGMKISMAEIYEGLSFT